MNLWDYPLSRRHLAKGMGLAGLAGLLFSPVLPWRKSTEAATDKASIADANSPVSLVLVSHVAEHDAFLRGVQAALPGVGLPLTDTASGMRYLDQLAAVLTRPPGTRVIGLVDNASAALIVASARSHGASLSWLGQHASNDHRSRHQLLNASATRRCVSAWSQHLQACAADYELRSSAPHQRLPDLHLGHHSPGENASGDWAFSLGYLLASDRDRPLPAPVRRPDAPPLRGQFVSFLIEV